jgi:EmrB/QacA subfamily drug resistance transporter
MQTETRRTVLLAGLLLGLFFSALDQTVVGTAMPRIIGELGGLSIMTWVTTAYMLTSTTVVPIAGKLSDLYGRRIIYVTGLVVFMLGSALCGFSQNMTQLILFRGLQGVGGGIMIPLSMTIIGDIFPPEQRGKWQGVLGAVFALSSVVGPSIGGWIVDNSSWQWVFYVNLPIGALAAATIYVGLKTEKRLVEKAVIDYAGTISLIIATVSLLLGMNLGGTDFAWYSWQIISLFTLSIAFWVMFVKMERNAHDPILSLDLFRNRIFTITNIVGFLMGLGMFGSIMFLPLFLQGVIGASATESGNAMIPMMMAMVLTSIVAGRFINFVSFRTMFITGMLLMAVGFYLLSTMTILSTQFTAIAYVIILGLGMGTIMPNVTLAVQSAFPPAKRGVATAATQFFRSIGGTLGMTLLGVIFNAYSRNRMDRDFFPVVQSIPGLQAGPFGSMLESAHADPHGLFNVLLSPAVMAAIPLDIQNIILPPLKTTLAESLQIVFLTAMFVMFAGIVASWWMGNAGIKKKSEKPAVQEAGVTLFAEGVATEIELSAELVPDLIDDRSSTDS